MIYLLILWGLSASRTVSDLLERLQTVGAIGAAPRRNASLQKLRDVEFDCAHIGDLHNHPFRRESRQESFGLK